MTTEEMLAAAAVNSWKLVIGRFDGAVASLSDENLQKQVAPGRNRLLYLVGHLTAVHDRMFALLGLGERLHPELDEIYIANPDQTLPDSISPVCSQAGMERSQQQTHCSFPKAHAPAMARETHRGLRGRLRQGPHAQSLSGSPQPHQSRGVPHGAGRID